MTTATTKPKPGNKPAVVAWDKPTNKAGLESLIGPAVVEAFNRGLPKFLAGGGERLIRCMISECQTNPALLDCTPASLFGAAMRAAQLGLVIGGPTGEAYLTPFNNSKKGVREAQLIIGYKGLVKLAYRSGEIRRITPVTVRDGDEFSYTRGMNQDLRHVPQRGKNGRAATDYYVIVELVNGGKDFETYTHEDAIEHRNRYALSKGFGPWFDMKNGGFEEMACKTLIRRLSKRLPLSAEMADAVRLDDAADAGESQSLALYAAQLPGLSPAAEPDPAFVAADLRERLDDVHAAADAVYAGDHTLPGMGGGNLPD